MNRFFSHDESDERECAETVRIVKSLPAYR